MSSNSPRPSKAERTASAREQLAARQAGMEAAQKRKSMFVKLGVLAAVIAVIAIVVGLIVQNNNGQVADAGPVPNGGNVAGGIVVTSPTTLGGTGGQVDASKVAAPKTDGSAPTPRDLTVGKKGGPINITLYVDANCIHCADFEATNGAQINKWLEEGKVTVEYRNVGFLDRGSATNYSSRAANALACVADKSPQAYTKFVTALWGHYQQGEMKNSELAQMAIDAGADSSVSSCIDNGTFRPFVKYGTAAAQADGVVGTPSIFVQGKELILGKEDFVKTVEAAIKANA